MFLENRNIIHMDLDTFFVSVERLNNPKLIGKPVIIGGTSDRSVVASCSYEARKYGVRSAMPMKLARNLCNDALIIRGDMEMYSKYSKVVTEIIAEQAPLYEKASIDEHYIDVTGMDRFYGAHKWSQELRKRIIKESGLPISMGLSKNKTVSKIATGEAKPNGERYIESENIQSFLSPLSISKIPGIGEKTYQTLRSMGISKIMTLTQMPVEMLEKVMGKNGIVIWRKANGIDPTPVIPYSERQSISTETTFETDTIDIHYIKNLLISMVEDISFQLRKKEKLASCITIKVRYSNFDTHTMQRHIPYTSFDHVIIKNSQELFERLYQRRMLIRLIGVKLSGLVGGTHQINMFEDTPEMLNLYAAMDRMKRKYGYNAVQRAISLKQ
jgi:DNA polymerase-4